MAERQSDNDAANIFWPGYVDAVSNLVLNLLFLLTIMTIAVFMFALESGRAIQALSEAQLVPAADQGETVSAPSFDALRENLALKREIERLNLELALRDVQDRQAGGLPKPANMAARVAETGNVLDMTLGSDDQTADAISRTRQPVAGLEEKLAGDSDIVEVTVRVPEALTGLDKTIPGDAEVIVRFRDDAVGFTPEEEARLLVLLEPVVARGEAVISVDVPPGFSEARRMAFYRAMAVRNLLIQMEMTNERIEVLVREGKSNGNAAIVRIK